MKDSLPSGGYAEIVDGELHSHLFIHLGDDSAFRAVRQIVETKTAPRRKA